MAVTGFNAALKEYHADIYLLDIPLKDGTHLQVEVAEVEKVVGNLLRFKALPQGMMKEDIIDAAYLSIDQPEVLLGVDICCKLFTGAILQLLSGFTCFSSKLGPVLCGAGRTNGWPGTPVNSRTLSPMPTKLSVITSWPVLVEDITDIRPEVFIAGMHVTDHTDEEKSLRSVLSSKHWIRI
jgi:hypothetical protein